MQVKSSLNLKPKSNCQNDVRFECLSRKRSSNWRPPVDTTVCINSAQQPPQKCGSSMKPKGKINYSLSSKNLPAKNDFGNEFNKLNEFLTYNGDIETNHINTNEKMNC